MVLGHVQQFRYALLHHRFAVFVHQPLQVPRPHLTGPDQRVEITLLIPSRPHVRQDHVHHVMAGLALVPDLDRRNTQPFGVNLGRVRVIAGRHRPADVGQVALAHRPEHQLAFVKHRHVHAGVDDVRPAIRGIIVQHQIAVMDVARKITGDRFHRGDQRAKVDRNVLSLQDHLGRMVEQRRRIVMRKVENRRPRRLLQRQRHLALRRFQNPAHY